jgi:hypothetical protein
MTLGPDDRKRIHAAVDTLLDVFQERDAPPQASTPTAPASTSASLIDRQELARQLSVSPATIARLVRKAMPYHLVGEAKRFDLAECRTWLDRRRSASVAPVAPQPAGAPGTNDATGIGGVRLLSRRKGPASR